MKLQKYEQIPLYRRARDVLRDTHVLTARMNKAYKYTLGQALRTAAQELTETIFLAYEEKECQQTKLGFIEQIQNKTQLLLINYRIAAELQQVPLKDQGTQIEHIVEIIRQARGWEDALRKQNDGISHKAG